jgi:hypothetical protein
MGDSSDMKATTHEERGRTGAASLPWSWSSPPCSGSNTLFIPG